MKLDLKLKVNKNLEGNMEDCVYKLALDKDFLNWAKINNKGKR